MERYLRRNRLAEAMDGAGAALMMHAGALLWFVYLWGLGIPAMLAGAALGMMCQLGRRCLRRRTVARRERSLRRSIGAELMLEQMQLSSAKEAHKQAVQLLGARWPLQMEQLEDAGALCRQGEEKLLVMCLQIPTDGELSAGDLLRAQREARRMAAERAVLCVLGRTGAKVAARAENAVVPVRIVRRETLAALAGSLAPATDEQLVELGRRRRGKARGSIRRLVLRRDKAQRYWGYGTVMLLLYVLTGLRLYAPPGMICLCLAVFSRSGRSGPDQL